MPMPGPAPGLTRTLRTMGRQPGAQIRSFSQEFPPRPALQRDFQCRATVSNEEETAPDPMATGFGAGAVALTRYSKRRASGACRLQVKKTVGKPATRPGGRGWQFLELGPGTGTGQPSAGRNIG